MQLIFNLFRNVAYTGKEIHLYLKYHISTYLLSKARKYNFQKCIPILIHFGADIDVKDDFKNTLLHEAVINKDLATIIALMSHNANPDLPNVLDETPWAIAFNYFNPHLESNLKPELKLEIIGALLKSKNDNHAQIATKALLRHAKKYGFSYIDNFIELGANIKQDDKDGNTLLHFAATDNKTHIINTLLENDANIFHRNKKGEMPIHNAAKVHATEDQNFTHGGALVQLLNNGADPNAKNSAGDTPLHIALHDPLQTVDTIKRTLDFLIEHKADITLCNNKEYTLLHTAVIGKNITALKYLVNNYNIDINSKDLRGSTPLHLAMYHMASRKVIDCLLSYGADVFAVDDYGNIPLHYLMKTNSRKRIFNLSKEKLEEQINIFIELFNKDKTQITARNNNGKNPLHCMIEENSDVSIIEHIFKSIEDDNYKIDELRIAVDNFGNTLLHTTCEYMNPTFLAERNKMHFASDILGLEENALSTVEFLVRMGFDLQAVNNDGETPLDIAKRCKESNNDIVKYLEDAISRQHPKDQPTAITPLLQMMQERYVPPQNFVTEQIRRAIPKAIPKLF